MRRIEFRANQADEITINKAREKTGLRTNASVIRKALQNFVRGPRTDSGAEVDTSSVHEVLSIRLTDRERRKLAQSMPRYPGRSASSVVKTLAFERYSGHVTLQPDASEQRKCIEIDQFLVVLMRDYPYLPQPVTEVLKELRAICNTKPD